MGQIPPKFTKKIAHEKMQVYGGRYTNILDAKGRINLPSKYRNVTEKDSNGEMIFIMTRGSDKNIAVFPIDEWYNQIEDLKAKITNGRKRRTYIRKMNYYASYQKVDKQGRINIPADLIEYANLDKEVHILGYGKRFEIWNPERLDVDIETDDSEDQELQEILDF